MAQFPPLAGACYHGSVQPTLTQYTTAIRSAYQRVIDRVADDPTWQSRDMGIEQSRSLAWVSLLATSLHDLWVGEQGVVTRCKPFEGLDPPGNLGELLTDVHVIRTTAVASVQTRTPIEFASNSLVAVESEFEGNSRAWLDDLSKLFLVRAPMLIFASSRAGNGPNTDLAARQLHMYAEAATRGLPRATTLLLALMPHPRHWACDTSKAELDIQEFAHATGRFEPITAEQKETLQAQEPTKGGSGTVQISSHAELLRQRSFLGAAAEYARESLRRLAMDPHALTILKFNEVGCHPLVPTRRLNLAEQIDQQATYEVALDATELLLARYPGKRWTVAPGASGSGHDILSHDGEVAAEVFAAVRPTNNQKFANDVAKISVFTGPEKYVIFRAPDGNTPAAPEGVRVIRLAMDGTGIREERP